MTAVVYRRPGALGGIHLEDYRGQYNNNEFAIYKNVVEHAHDIILILTEEGKIIDANKQAVCAYGYSYEELKKLDIFQLRDSGTLEMAREQFKKAKAKGIEFETQHYRKDGSFFSVEVKSIDIYVGSDYYIASIVRDISARREKEKEVRVLASIVESSEDAILGIATEGIITSWNKGAERLYGYRKEEILGLHASILVPEESNDDIDAIISRVRNKDKIEYYESVR